MNDIYLKPTAFLALLYAHQIYNWRPCTFPLPTTPGYSKFEIAYSNIISNFEIQIRETEKGLWVIYFNRSAFEQTSDYTITETTALINLFKKHEIHVYQKVKSGQHKK